MKNDEFIPIRDVSDFCHVEITLLKDFAEYKLINIQLHEKTECIMAGEIQQIKRIIDLYRGLGVNKEGIEIILAMRDRILEMHNEITMLKQHIDHLESDQKFRYFELPSRMGLLIDYDE